MEQAGQKDVMPTDLLRGYRAPITVRHQAILRGGYLHAQERREMIAKTRASRGPKTGLDQASACETT